MTISLVISIPISLSIYLSYYPIKKYIDSCKLEKNKTKETRENLLLQLSLGKEEIICKYLLSLFGYVNETKISSNHYIVDKKEIIFNFQSTLDQETFNLTIRHRESDEIVIFCTKSNVLYTPKDVNIETIDIDKIYQKLIQEKQSLPTQIELKKQPKYRLKDILCIVFNKSKSTKYFYASIMLIFISLFTPFTNYYIIISTILLIAAIYSRFNTMFN